MPTLYPKCSPTEMMGLLVLLNSHKGSEDVALLADDLDLEIDEIFPSLEWAEALGLVTVKDGRATFTASGTQLVEGSITTRKTLLRELLKKSTLFRALLQALDSSPTKRLPGEEVTALISFTSAPADALIQNIINWGRYAELFRYDSDAGVLIPAPTSSRGGAKVPPSPTRSTAPAARPQAPSAKTVTAVPAVSRPSTSAKAPSSKTPPSSAATKPVATEGKATVPSAKPAPAPTPAAKSKPAAKSETESQSQ